MSFRLDAAITAAIVSGAINLGLWCLQYRRQRRDAGADAGRDLLRREAAILLELTGDIVGGLQLMTPGQNPSAFLLGRRVNLYLAAGRIDTLVGDGARAALAARLDAACGEKRAKDRDQALTAARDLQRSVHALLHS